MANLSETYIKRLNLHGPGICYYISGVHFVETSPKAVGLREIAERLNVSVSLVSKVLNDRLGNSGATQDTIAAIRNTARSLGYRKNQAAVGVEGSGICEDIVRGVAAGAAACGQRMTLRFFGSADEFLSYCPEVTPSLLDGIIVAGIQHAELNEKLIEIQNSGVKVVTTHEDGRGSPFENVGVDQIRVGQIATEHLIARGCRKIAHIETHAPRTQGYYQALKENGLPIDPSRVYHSASAFFTYGAGEEAVAHFLARGIEFDGLVTQSDQQSMGALNALLRAGKRSVPSPPNSLLEPAWPSKSSWTKSKAGPSSRTRSNRCSTPVPLPWMSS
jgi:LacI family transcriptional regulator